MNEFCFVNNTKKFSIEHNNCCKNDKHLLEFVHIYPLESSNEVIYLKYSNKSDIKSSSYLNLSMDPTKFENNILYVNKYNFKVLNARLLYENNLNEYDFELSCISFISILSDCKLIIRQNI